MNKLKSLLLFACLIVMAPVSATIVEVQTTEGSFQINLFDNATPQTVSNFLNYVDQNAYDEVVFHRLVPGFVLQGGGFKFDDEFIATPTYSAIINEPVYSNVRGTIAMAKRDGYVHSATNQWFINLEDNSANLDLQNGAFTVFGQVIGDGMDLIDQISQFSCEGRPVVNTTTEECNEIENNNASLTSDLLVTINSVIVIDDNTDTANDLNPVENTLIDTIPSESNSGGSFSALLVLLSTLIFWRRRQKV